MVHVRLGIVYFHNGKRDRAIASWKTALELDPNTKEARELLDKYGSANDSTAGNVKGKARAA
jgi:hypothetical protein